MIHKTDQILINGTNQIYNGYIYNLDYQPSFGQAPSYCTLNLISENGNYSITSGDLQVLTTDNIQIGTGISLDMYPVSYKEELGPGGKILSIKYIDTSIILDKKIVVLNGRQGNDGSFNNPINPLPTTSGSGNASLLTYVNDQFQGSCYIPVGKQLLRSDETAYQVLEVLYTFPELMTAINLNGIIIAQDSLQIIANSSQYYATSYYGTLRNVLSQWCADLGYTFYWENNQLHLIDLTTQLILNTSAYDNASQAEQSTEVSIEDTVGRIACAFYGQDFQKDTVPFSQETALSFNVITLAQLGFSTDQINSVKAAYYGEDIFFGYHFLINSTYGANIIGLNPSPGNNIILSSDQVAQVAQKLQDDISTGPAYNQYWYAQFNKANITQQNYAIFERLAKLVGKYYVKPMTYGDYKQISNSEYPIQFCASSIQAGLTPLGELAAYLGSASERLDQFLRGIPYTPPVNNNDPSQNSNLGNTNGQFSYNADSSIVSATTPYDSEAGFCILTVPDQSWYLNGQPINQSLLQQELIEDGSYTVSPRVRDSDNQTLNTLMELTNAGVYASLPNNSDYQWDLVCDVNFTDYRALPLNIVSPEVQNPNVLSHLTLNAPYIQTLPQIEEFFRSETDKQGNTVNCHSNVIKNEINYRQITNGDMTILGTPNNSIIYVGNAWNVRLAYPAAPNPQNLDEAFILFTKNLTLSKTNPTIVKTYNFPYIDIPGNLGPSLANGLMALNIRIDEKGITSNYTIGTRLMQVPSLSVIQQNIAWQRGTNQSRYLAYTPSFNISNGGNR